MKSLTNRIPTLIGHLPKYEWLTMVRSPQVSVYIGKASGLVVKFIEYAGSAPVRVVVYFEHSSYTHVHDTELKSMRSGRACYRVYVEALKRYREALKAEIVLLDVLIDREDEAL